jgi:hypothetical protein
VYFVNVTQYLWVSVCQDDYLPVLVSVYLSDCLSVSLPVSLAIYLYVCLSVCQSLCMSACLSVTIPFHIPCSRPGGKNVNKSNALFILYLNYGTPGPGALGSMWGDFIFEYFEFFTSSVSILQVQQMVGSLYCAGTALLQTT